MVNRFRKDDDWNLESLFGDDGDYQDFNYTYDDYENDEKPKNTKNKRRLKIKNKKDHNRNKNSEKKDHKRLLKHKQKDTLIKDDDDNYDDINEVIYDEIPINYKKFALIGLVLMIFLVFSIGYLNTDFDDSGQGFVVSYDLHYERRYVNKSDDLLEYFLELEETLPTMINKLPTDTINYNERFEDAVNKVQGLVDSLSSYTEIPKNMSSYHTQLINFGQNTIEMLNVIKDNYNSSDYWDYTEAAYEDYCTELTTLRGLRSQVHKTIYRNIK